MRSASALIILLLLLSGCANKHESTDETLSKRYMLSKTKKLLIYDKGELEQIVILTWTNPHELEKEPIFVLGTTTHANAAKIRLNSSIGRPVREFIPKNSSTIISNLPFVSNITKYTAYAFAKSNTKTIKIELKVGQKQTFMIFYRDPKYTKE